MYTGLLKLVQQVITFKILFDIYVCMYNKLYIQNILFILYFLIIMRFLFTKYLRITSIYNFLFKIKVTNYLIIKIRRNDFCF